MLILNQFSSSIGQIALLIDPEKTNTEKKLTEIAKLAEYALVDYFFVGGSTVTREDVEQVVKQLKKLSKIPVVLFPGASHQLSKDADALLFLNLISGRNPDYLIGHQVTSAEEVFQLNLEVIPTSYLLIDGGKLSSVAYVSQTTPIPQHQTRIALNTATAGFLMGHKVTYLDAGSGAETAVPSEMIEEIQERLASPVIVGGGIRCMNEIARLGNAGANVLVIGNKIEEDVNFLLDIASYQSKRKNQATEKAHF